MMGWRFWKANDSFRNDTPVLVQQKPTPLGRMAEYGEAGRGRDAPMKCACRVILPHLFRQPYGLPPSPKRKA